MTGAQRPFDIVVPVYNSLHHARVCIDSVKKHAAGLANLVVINDRSDAYTAGELRKLVADCPFARLIDHEVNLGYLKSVNEGIQAGNSPYVILLNSDAILPPGALQRLQDALESNPDVGIINPVSTWANWTRIPFPPGSSRLTLIDTVRSLGEEELVDIWNASGFFFIVRRSLYDQLGLFDEAYNPGYWEETDFCMLALKSGFRVAVDRQLYIYHHGWGSFLKDGRDKHMARNREVFFARWKEDYTKYEKRWRASNPVEGVSARVLESSPHYDGLKVRFVVSEPEFNAPNLGVVQLTNALIDLDVDANIVFLNDAPSNLLDTTPMHFRPSTVAAERAGQEFPQCDVLVATDFSALCVALAVANRRPGTVCMYLANTENDPRLLDENERSLGSALGLTDATIARSQRLRHLLSCAGASPVIVGQGINRDIFYELPHLPRNRLLIRVGSNVRRETISAAVGAIRSFASLRPDVEIALWGEDASAVSDLDCKKYDDIHRLTEVAGILRGSVGVVYLGDVDEFRHYGLGVMACGAIPISGFDMADTSFAKHGHNCLLGDMEDADWLAQAITTLFDTADYQAQLRSGATSTAERHCHRQEAMDFFLMLRRARAAAGTEDREASRGLNEDDPGVAVA